VRHGLDTPRRLTRASSDLPMRRFPFALVVLLSIAAVPTADGQVPTTTTGTVPRGTEPMFRPATDSLFRRARRFVAEGNGVAGRALVDSLLRAADPATAAYGDALYWHGALAPTAAEAERDYRRVIVEYPLAYYADDALLAIAELEQARGDRAGALAHLQRFVKEHPSSPGRGVAALGAARLAFEQRDTPLGCSMIAVARASAPSADVELRNQIDYHGRQCTGAAVAATPPVTTSPVAVAPSPAPPAATAPRRVSTPAPESTMPQPVTPPPHRAPAAPVRAAPPPAAASPRPSTPVRGAPMYTIQVAAYDTRPPAEQLVRKLATRNVKARVSGTSKPFRVRLEFYRTHREAADVAAALKARGIVGFVTQEVPPAGTSAP
jgi:hypothetical protein